MARETPVAIVAGGSFGPSLGAEVRAGLRPRIDVLEFQRLWNAPLYDFGRVDLAARASVRGRFIQACARRTGFWSQLLAVHASPELREVATVFATGEDVGFPLSILFRRFGCHRPRLVVRLEQPHYGRTASRRALFGVYAELALAGIDSIICRTTAHVQYLHSVMRLPMSKVLFVPETCDSRFFSAEGSVVTGFDPPARPPTYIVAAGLEHRDYRTLIDAVQGLPIQLMIGAASPWSHAGFDAGVIAQLPDNVSVGSFDRVQLRALYSNARFVVVPIKPTLRACGMNVILQAWSMGKAVITTETVGLRDYVIPEVNALTVAPYDVGGWRSAIVRLLAEPVTCSRLACAGRQQVELEWNLDTYLGNITSIVIEGPTNIDQGDCRT